MTKLFLICIRTRSVMQMTFLLKTAGEKNVGSFTSSNNTTLIFSICYQTGLQKHQDGNDQQSRESENRVERVWDWALPPPFWPQQDTWEAPHRTLIYARKDGFLKASIWRSVRPSLASIWHGCRQHVGRRPSSLKKAQTLTFLSSLWDLDSKFLWKYHRLLAFQREFYMLVH